MCEVLIVFCVERPSEEDAPLGEGETNRSLKERLQTIEIKSTVLSETTTSPTKHQKAELKDFVM